MLKLLLTIAVMSLAADRARANLWCHCDGDLCTAGNRTQVCPDKMPEQIRLALLGAFSGHNQQGVSAQILREMLVERGFDQMVIADIFAEMTTLNIDTYIAYAKLNTSDFRAYLVQSTNPEMETMLRGAMHFMRDIVANRHSLVISDIEFVTLRHYVNLLFAGHTWRHPAQRAILLAGVDHRNVWSLTTPAVVAVLHSYFDAIVPAMVEAVPGIMAALEARHRAERTAPPADEAMVARNKVGVGVVLRGQYGMPESVVEAVLDRITGYTIEAFLPRSYVTEYVAYVMSNPAETPKQQLNEDFMRAKGEEFAARYKPRELDDKEFAEAKEMARQTMLKVGIEVDAVDFMTAVMDRTNIRYFDTGYEVLGNAITKRFGATNDSEIILMQMARMASVANSRWTDEQFVNYIHHTVVLNAALDRNLTEPKRRGSPHYWSDQFCMKAVLPDEQDKTYRFCGHFATQAVGFQFRTGCHYEQILGMAPARFCRCATHLCNGAGSMFHGMLWYLITAALILSYKHI